MYNMITLFVCAWKKMQKGTYQNVKSLWVMGLKIIFIFFFIPFVLSEFISINVLFSLHEK